MCPQYFVHTKKIKKGANLLRVLRVKGIYSRGNQRIVSITASTSSAPNIMPKFPLGVLPYWVTFW